MPFSFMVVRPVANESRAFFVVLYLLPIAIKYSRVLSEVLSYSVSSRFACAIDLYLDLFTAVIAVAMSFEVFNCVTRHTVIY